jgi:hypothetical protein
MGVAVDVKDEGSPGWTQWQVALQAVMEGGLCCATKQTTSLPGGNIPVTEADDQMSFHRGDRGHGFHVSSVNQSWGVQVFHNDS